MCTIITPIGNSLIEVWNKDNNILKEYKVDYKDIRKTLIVSFWYLPLHKILKISPNFAGVEILCKRTVSGEFRKIRVSTKFPHQEIR